MKQEFKENNGQAVEIVRRVVLEREITCKSDSYDHQTSEYAKQLISTKLDKTQIRQLETLAYTTGKISDLIDWLKIHVGRDKDRNRWAQNGIGRNLIANLERLREDAWEIVMKIEERYPLSQKDPDLVRRVHLRLIREYLKHLAAHFEYEQAERLRRKRYE